MALGFGFNKQKVLAAAEKYVQQGKIQNAIIEYEKVSKEDPKDLTVLNTIGDLYGRVGQNDKAASAFKKVGDAYANEGFTVKAIAMYKKLTKLSPGATEAVVKLAELYTQQGLYNDARQQYVQVADASMKSGDTDQAARIFQKILELDPENTAMQSKLADLYIKLGKKEDARNIYWNAAQSLYAKGSLDAANDALGRVLSLDPANGDALLLRGLIAADAGDGASAVACLEKIPNLDSRPEGLRALLRGLLLVKRLEEAGAAASKLLTVHNDPSGVSSYAEALLVAGDFENALKLYDQHADKFLATNPQGLLEALHASLSRIKENVPALEIVRRLYTKAGDTSHTAEATELLAHACVQAGDLAKGRDLYKQLVDLEPENPIHAQNYKQVVARLGEDAAARPLTKEEGQQAFMVEELEHAAPSLEQEYPPELASVIKAAVTESELFDSYNMAAKAIPPLEAVLPKAPRDGQVNHRLASLYARVNRFAEAAQCCETLASVYTAAGYNDQARQYMDMAVKYRERVGEAAAAPVAAAAPPPPSPAPAAEAPAVAEFAMEVTPPAAEAPAAPVAEFSMMDVAAAEAPAAAPVAAHEIDLSGEWEQMTSVEQPPAAEPSAQFIGRDTAAAAVVTDLIEEIKFYLSQSMWEEARSGIGRLEVLRPDSADLPALREQLAAGTAPPAAVEVAPAAEASVAEFTFETPAEPVVEAPPPPPPPPPKPVAAPPPPPKPAPPPPKPAAAPPPPPKPAPPPPKPVAAPPPPPPPPAAGDVLGDLVSGLEESLGDDFALGAPPPAAAAPPPAAKAAPPPPKPAPPPPTAPTPAPAASLASPEATSVLTDMFSEFKEEAEETAGEAEDPDTHYNLGVAFKEMGLLDEAIGELQKVAQAVDKGQPFAQVVQAYTWLAACFQEKGVPQAAIKWYEKALKAPGIGEEGKMAVYYDLASAHEAAGNKKAALDNFMEVYGANIDYRDVAERIKALKS
jgi:tetratricopeptide (TPR) repeat protein